MSPYGTECRVLNACTLLNACFLTGASGFLGSHVARARNDQGSDLLLLVRAIGNYSK